MLLIVDLKNLIKLKEKNPNNPSVGYFSINSLGNKFAELKEVYEQIPIHMVCLDETKLDLSFPDAPV